MFKKLTRGISCRYFNKKLYRYLQNDIQKWISNLELRQNSILVVEFLLCGKLGNYRLAFGCCSCASFLEASFELASSSYLLISPRLALLIHACCRRISLLATRRSRLILNSTADRFVTSINTVARKFSCRAPSDPLSVSSFCNFLFLFMRSRLLVCRLLLIRRIRIGIGEGGGRRRGGGGGGVCWGAAWVCFAVGKLRNSIFALLCCLFMKNQRPPPQKGSEDPCQLWGMKDLQEEEKAWMSGLTRARLGSIARQWVVWSLLLWWIKV